MITSKLIPHVRRYHFYYVVRTYSTYGQGILLSTHVHTYFFMISPTKHTKNVLAGSSAALIRDEIHCNEYPGTRRVMSVGYPGSKFSTRCNPSTCWYLWNKCTTTYYGKPWYFLIAWQNNTPPFNCESHYHQHQHFDSIPYAEASHDYVCKTSAATSSHVQNLHITETTI